MTEYTIELKMKDQTSEAAENILDWIITYIEATGVEIEKLNLEEKEICAV